MPSLFARSRPIFKRNLPAGQSIQNVFRKMSRFDWWLVLCLAAASAFGVVMLYSVAGGHFEPWAMKHIQRFIIGFMVLCTVAIIDIRWWLRVSFPLYIISLLLLILVELVGTTAMGAQRWLTLGPVQIQPSEFMKITLVLALAAYFQYTPPNKVSQFWRVCLALLMIGVPVALVVHQPDLGTAVLLLAGALGMMFASGIHWAYFVTGGVSATVALPFLWTFLHTYQKQRILTFFKPESDPLGAGYHIMQSKIALGSGGVSGKGLMNGTQSQLNFLPEKHTDFIFTTMGEELGLLGCLALLCVYFIILAIGLKISLKAKNRFGAMVAMGVCMTFFLYIFVNVAMVMGLLPVVGVPLPFVSYGGTAMMTLMFGFGLLMNVWVHRTVEISALRK